MLKEHGSDSGVCKTETNESGDSDADTDADSQSGTVFSCRCPQVLFKPVYWLGIVSVLLLFIYQTLFTAGH